MLISYFFRRLFRNSKRKSQRYESTHITSCINTIKKRALSEAALKDGLKDLPKVKVRRIIDGDTVIVTNGWSEITIRLDSIDCPEDGQHWGDMAMYGLIKLIGGCHVHLEEYGLDVHGRTVATIYVHDKRKNEFINVNERMVTIGHAWVMHRFYDHLPTDRQHKLDRLENWAKSKRIGLWQAPNPIPPWKRRSET